MFFAIFFFQPQVTSPSPFFPPRSEKRAETTTWRRRDVRCIWPATLMLGICIHSEGLDRQPAVDGLRLLRHSAVRRRRGQRAPDGMKRRQSHAPRTLPSARDIPSRMTKSCAAVSSLPFPLEALCPQNG